MMQNNNEEATPGGPGRLAACKKRPNTLPLLLLLLLSALTQLPGFAHPNGVVFDEVHFGSFATAYCCNHEYFFDPHPPHAKLVIAGVASLMGYEGGLAFDKIGLSYGDISPVPLRLAPALAGCLLPLIVFLVLRQLGASRAAAFFGGLLLVFDNSLTVHTRVISLDGILLVSIFGALGLYLAAKQATSLGGRLSLSFLAGCAAGLAVGTKFTGLAIVGLIGLAVLMQLYPRQGRARIAHTLQQAGGLLVGAVLVYLLGWALHFGLLTKPGPGDEWGVPTGDLAADVIKIHGQMFSAHANLPDPHDYGSPWWSWPIMKRPIFFWDSPDSDAMIYSIGNPLVWWGGALMLLAVLVNLAITPVTYPRVAPEPRRHRPIFWLPLVGFFASYLPLADVKRVLFMYHYLTPLIFSLMLVVLWLDFAGWTSREGLLRQRHSYYAVIGVLVLCFLLIAPLTYGLEAGSWLVDAIFSLFPGWR
jgi:dolichyl-phosphate-mannose-protein mannosyltransferase